MLPKNLSIPQLRKEIRRRLKISEQLGLIKKPMAIALKSIAKSVRLERSTSDTWKTWQFSLAWLSPREGAEYDATAFLNTRLQTLSLPLESEQETQQDLIILVYAYLATHDISTYIWEQCCVNPEPVLDFNKEWPPLCFAYKKGGVFHLCQWHMWSLHETYKI